MMPKNEVKKGFLVLMGWLVCVASVNALDYTWDNGAGTGRWDVPQNWNPDGTLTDGDVANIIDAATYGFCLIDSATTASAFNVKINETNAAAGHLKMTGGTLSTSRMLIGQAAGMTSPALFEMTGGTATVAGTQNVLLANNVTAKGRIDISGGTYTVSGANLHIGQSGQGELYISGANTEVKAKSVVVGNQSNSEGTVVINGGLLESQTNNIITIGNNGKGTVTVDNGTLKSGSHLYIARYGGSAGSSLTVNNGVVNVNNLYLVSYDADTTVSMNNGTMTLGGELRLNEGRPQIASFYLNGGTLQSNGRFVIPAGTTPSNGWGKLYIWGGQAICGNQLAISFNSAKTGRVDIRYPGVLKVNSSFNTLNSIRDYIKDGFITGSSVSGRAYLALSEDTSANQIIVQAYNLSLAQAYDPSPIPGQLTDPVGRKLTWKSGDGAISHRVYLSQNIADVQVPVNTGSYVTTTATEYTPAGLGINKTYYWRVDEVAGGGVVTQGAVWSFTTWDRVTVEDFESYTSSGALQAVWGAAAGLYEQVGSSQPDPEGAGVKTMLLTMPATVSRTFSAAQDWSGFSALTMFLHGMPTTDVSNPSFSLYVKLTDSSNASSTVQFVSGTFPRYAASQLVQEPEHLWIQWNIAMSRFTGIQKTAIQKIEIGTLNGSGPLYIDDIRCYDRRYIAWEGDGDINNDQGVDMVDFVSLAKDWLRASAVVAPAAPTIPAVVEYDFNEDPLNYNDRWYSPGHAWDDKYAMVVSSLNVWAADAGRNGAGDGCLVLDGALFAKLNDPEFVFSNVSTAVSISVWAKGNDSLLPDASGFGHPLFVGFPKTGTAANSLTAFVPNEDAQAAFWTGPYGNQEVLTWQTSLANDFEGTWRHWVFVKDWASGEFKIYRDGQLVARRNTASVGLPVIGQFFLGRSPTGVTKYYGWIDDFKLYNYALSDAEALYLAGKTSPTTVNLVSQADLDGNGVVNASDLVRFVQDWLKDPLLWP